MKNAARIKKRLVLLIAFSIIWIFIGSLVIFHQEQVMGKTFKFSTNSFIVPKSKDERSAVKCLVKLSNDNSQNLILAVLADNLRELLLAGSFSLNIVNADDEIVSFFIDQSPGLRAPPIA